MSIPSQPERDHLQVSEIHGAARLHAARRELTADEHAAAVAAVRELAAGRADLLAEAAGIMLGASEGEQDEPLMRQAAELCRAAGADEALIPGWIEEGRQRKGERPPSAVRCAPEDPAGTAPAWPGRLRGADVPA